jgi:hypothetical protein
MPDLIKNIIPEVIDKLAGGNPEWQNSLNRAWEAAVDNKTRKHAKLYRFHKGKLLINVDSPVWMFQLNFKKTALLRRLQAEFPELAAISFRIGKVN